MGDRLFHFSDDPTIELFEPRPVRVPSARLPGQDWLNGPLVWSIDEAHQAVYLFPRDCPRILAWPTPATSEADRERWWGAREATMIAHVEWTWLEPLRTTVLHRYELPPATFEPIEDDAWMLVSRQSVVPLAVEAVPDLFGALRSAGVELRVMERLTPLRSLWDETTLHVSGIRLRNARDWPA